jgi:hypothetical protein
MASYNLQDTNAQVHEWAARERRLRILSRTAAAALALIAAALISEYPPEFVVLVLFFVVAPLVAIGSGAVIAIRCFRRRAGKREPRVALRHEMPAPVADEFGVRIPVR